MFFGCLRFFSYAYLQYRFNKSLVEIDQKPYTGEHYSTVYCMYSKKAEHDGRFYPNKEYVLYLGGASAPYSLPAT
jgi:hypothetical protein